MSADTSLYRYVHALHHRNTDIEPFAGLSMHPVEHMYYFACFAPSLWVFASPFAFMWNGIHLLISPAASHSGWEDHFQSDQFHCTCASLCWFGLKYAVLSQTCTTGSSSATTVKSAQSSNPIHPPLYSQALELFRSIIGSALSVSL